VSPFGTTVQEKLISNNFLVWKAVVLPAVRGARMFGYLDGSIKAPVEKIITETEVDGKKVQIEEDNPAYATWIEKDQQVLFYLLGTLSREVLVQVTDHQTAHAAWTTIQTMHASQSRAHVMYLRRTLNDLKKRDMTAVTYFNKLKALTDELALVGKKLDEDDIINVVLDGLDSDYNALVEVVSGRIDQGITLSEVYSMLLTAEARLVAQHAESSSSGGSDFSVNLASRNGYNGGGRYNGWNRGGSSRGNDGRGYDQGRYDGRHGGRTNQGGGGYQGGP
jgi:hypothetical protein